MYIPNPLPEGPTYVYIMKDADTGWFKIGLSKDPKRRRGELRAGSFRSMVSVFYTTAQSSYFAALYVEQTIITLLKNHGYECVGDDWFLMDELAAKGAATIMADLSRMITHWELRMLETECMVPNDSVYGKYLSDNDNADLQYWYEVSPGHWASEPIGQLARRNRERRRGRNKATQ